jgi:hypothetical protein
MNLFLIAIIGITLVSFSTSEIWAQNSVTSQYGGLNTDQAVYSLERHETIHVKISGVGQDTNLRERVSLIITLPDSTKSNHSIFSTNDGYFELLFPISYDSLGTYKVFASVSGKILGEIYFTVEEKIKENTNQSAPKTPTSPNVSSPSISSLITIRTDSPSYESGDTIYISGTVPNYDQSDSNNQMQVSLQIINPKNNLVTISQISPNSDNTYSTSVKGAGSMWKFAGEYTVRANFFQQNAFTTFQFSIPSTSIIPIPQSTSTLKSSPKVITQLTLNSIPDSLLQLSSNSKAWVTFSGTLRMSDGTPMSGEDVYVQDTRNNIKLKFQTNNIGKFSGVWKNTQVGSNYQMQAFYDGSDDTKPSKSQIEYFDVKLKPVSTTPKPTFTSSSPPQDNSWIAVIAVLAIIAVGIIVVKRRKSTGTSSKKQTMQTQSSASVMSYWECPKCLSGDIQNNPDGSVNCPDCNFRE